MTGDRIQQATALDEASMTRMLGKPTDVSGVGQVGTSLLSVAFELYKETAMVVFFISNLAASEDLSLPRNQAIQAGLAVRIAKYMASVLALMVDKVREHGDVIMTINRCIVESATNLWFFSEKASEHDFEEFVRSSLRPERDTQKLIDANVQARGTDLPIEKRMSRSIARVFRLSGVSDIKELEKIPKRKTYKEILTLLGRADAYPLFQGIPSHMVHGTWMDLVLHHLQESDTGFKPKQRPYRLDVRLLLPQCRLVLEASSAYIRARFVGFQDVELLLARIDDLLQRIGVVDHAHEATLSDASA